LLLAICCLDCICTCRPLIFLTRLPLAIPLQRVAKWGPAKPGKIFQTSGGAARGSPSKVWLARPAYLPVLAYRATHARRSLFRAPRLVINENLPGYPGKASGAFTSSAVYGTVVTSEPQQKFGYTKRLCWPYCLRETARLINRYEGSATASTLPRV
jgi:hypothetical protein